jgi:hypothetical protein
MSNKPHLRPNGAQPEGIPITVPPQPAPVQVIVEQAQTPQGPLVVLRFLSVNGQSVYFLGVEDARHIADLIRQRATPITLN